MAVNFASSEAAAREVVGHIVSAGGRAVAIRADIGSEPDIVRLFETAERELGPIKGLVNNAGVTGGFARVETVTAQALAKTFAVNVVGAILCAREAVRRMSTRNGGTGGAIVNVSSLAARTGAAGEWVHYAASKGAIDSFTIGLAREVATRGNTRQRRRPRSDRHRPSRRQRGTGSSGSAGSIHPHESPRHPG